MSKREMFGMSGIIRVTPAELAAMASRYNHESGEVASQIGRLRRNDWGTTIDVGRGFKCCISLSNMSV